MTLRPARMRPIGFTLIEVMVVIGIITIILALGLPAFSTIQAQQERSRLEQELDNLVSRARTMALADRTPTAVRFCPAEWEQAEADSGSVGVSTARAGQQVAVLYQYRFSGFDLNDPGEIRYEQRFERVPGVPPVVLPEGTWVAPAEATLDPAEGFDSTSVLNGTPSPDRFPVDPLNPPNSSSRLLHADDFLIVFDPETGLSPARWEPGAPERERRTAWHMSALKYDRGAPTLSFQTSYDRDDFNDTPNLAEPFRRYCFTGIVFYDREQLPGLAPAEDGDGIANQRRTFLRQNGRVFWVERNGSRLIQAGQGAS